MSASELVAQVGPLAVLRIWPGEPGTRRPRPWYEVRFGRRLVARRRTWDGARRCARREERRLRGA